MYDSLFHCPITFPAAASTHLSVDQLTSHNVFPCDTDCGALQGAVESLWDRRRWGGARMAFCPPSLILLWVLHWPGPAAPCYYHGIALHGAAHIQSTLEIAWWCQHTLYDSWIQTCLTICFIWCLISTSAVFSPCDGLRLYMSKSVQYIAWCFSVNCLNKSGF